MQWSGDAERVVYTAIFGGYDVLRPPPVTTDGWAWVCFADRELSCPPWQVVRIPATTGDSSSHLARRLKLLAHAALPQARYSVWVDGNVDPHCDLDQLIASYLDGADIAAHPHPLWSCLYQEATAVLETRKDAPGRVLPQVLRYARRRFPREAGLIATGVLLRRHCPAVAKFERSWWRELQTGSERDQLSVMVALRRTGLVPALFESDIWKGPLFTTRPHDAATDGSA